MAASFCKQAVDVRPHLFEKLFSTKLLRMVGDTLRIKIDFREFFYRVDDCFDRLLGEKNAGNALHDGFSCAPLFESNDRTPTGHGLDRDHAKILFTGENQGAASCIVMLKNVKSLRSHYGYGGASNTADLVEHLATADDNEIKFHFIEGTNG